MATIKAFSAIRPKGDLLELELLKHRLEPSEQSPGAPGPEDCREYLAALLESKRYVTDNQAIYIYSQRRGLDSPAIGIWALTSLDDLDAYKILPHENTIDVGLKAFVSYRDTVGLEGEPVLLAYPGDFELSRLISLVTAAPAHRRFAYGNLEHKLWKVDNDGMIKAFRAAMENLGACYIADGHHRIAAAGRLHKGKSQWISSVYMAFDQLQIGPYHRLVRPDSGLDRGFLARKIGEYYHMAYIPTNRPFIPDKKGTIGMYLSGVWYTLQPREQVRELFKLPDAKLLQDRILSGGLGINYPQRDARLLCFAGQRGFNQLLGEIAKDNSVIAFTLSGMSASELIGCADIGIALPPKSTYILPRMPFGILMHDGMDLPNGGDR